MPESVSRRSFLASAVLLATKAIVGAEEKERRQERQIEPPIGKQQAATAAAVKEIIVKHLPDKENGWSVSETDNFRLYHPDVSKEAECIGRRGEQVRMEKQQKWLGKVQEEWKPKCEVFVLADGDAYAQFTGVPKKSNGHSYMLREGRRVVSRTLYIRLDDKNMIDGTLPHETTHGVLAGTCEDKTIPRWADEGISILSESEELLRMHRKEFDRLTKNTAAFEIEQLLSMDGYPVTYADIFHEQAASFVEFLVHEKGESTVIPFVRDGLRQGYDAAFKKHFDCSLKTLEERWIERTFRY